MDIDKQPPVYQPMDSLIHRWFCIISVSPREDAAPFLCHFPCSLANRAKGQG
ncbi:MAG: hypothetical protein II278_10735 [Bacteroidaceae bacterium]|nr:hypothetical protein [Bacteroidaceae bacterium]